MDTWAWQQSIQLVFITPGRPVENSYIESFNGRLRDEFLNVNIFFSLADVRQQLRSWQTRLQRHRPHSALARPHAERVCGALEDMPLRLSQTNKAFGHRQGFPNGTLPRGLDWPPGPPEH